MSFEIPVLLIAWRRPETTRKVIEAIRKVQPARMYVACNGPSIGNPEEAELVNTTRELIAREIDWPCEIAHRYQEVNKGCKMGITGAISWLFENEETGIILEDDCVPEPDFFRFCSVLLDYYRYDERVWAISGNNLQNGKKRGKGSYYFSQYLQAWGWATWKRAWKQHDGEIRFWPEWKESHDWINKYPDPIERKYFREIYDKMHLGLVDTWDFQWNACIRYHGALVATSNYNLISNIGFGQGATHTTQQHWTANLPTSPLSNIIHPNIVAQDSKADRYTFNHLFGLKYLRFPYSLLSFAKRVFMFLLKKG